MPIDFEPSWMDAELAMFRGTVVRFIDREVLGREFGIAMTAVQVAGLVEERAKVEIEVTAVLPA